MRAPTHVLQAKSHPNLPIKRSSLRGGGTSSSSTEFEQVWKPGRKVDWRTSGNAPRTRRVECTCVLCTLVLNLPSTRFKRVGATGEKVEGVSESIFIGFRVNLFKPCSEIIRGNRRSFVVQRDSAKDEVIERLSAEV